MKRKNLGDWPDFYSRVTKYPWERAVYLVTHEPAHADLGHLLTRYEQLRAEAGRLLPHGPGFFRRLDKVSNERGAPASGEIWPSNES
jgi:hypothetical protein